MTARRAGALPGCGACELSRACWHLERAVAELKQARVAWGVWADDIRWMTEQRLGISDLSDERVLDDPGYGRALDMGTPFNEAVSAAETALRTAGGSAQRGAGKAADCPCAAVKAQIGSPHP